MKCKVKPETIHENSTYYHVFPATFHVILRKVDYLWDSVHCTVVNPKKTSPLSAGLKNVCKHIFFMKFWNWGPKIISHNLPSAQ